MMRPAALSAVILAFAAASFSGCGECGEAPPTRAPEGNAQTVSGTSPGGSSGEAIPLPGRNETFAKPKAETGAITAASDVKGRTPAGAHAASTSTVAGTLDPKKLAAVTDVGPADFDKEVLKSKVPVLVLYGTASCRPCAQVEFQLGTLASDYAGKVKFTRIDIGTSEAHQLLPPGLRRLPLPAFAFYQDGSPLNIRQGLPVAAEASSRLKKWLKTVIDGRDVRL